MWKVQKANKANLELKRRNRKTQTCVLGRGGDQVVSLLAFYSNLSKFEAYSF